MLQRAASNAYSWWWASHIRTKQSKWLEQNLQDLEEKVQYVLKLIEEDGDSFAKRAEMYYKKRPELIHFVEEAYRAYRALAERYDHISTELQNANNTIAYVFPEQVQFAMDDDDDDGSPRFPKRTPEMPKANVPKVPKIPNELKRAVATATKKLQPKKSMKGTSTPSVPKSGLSKREGHNEIDKLQKEILAMQTEKEFVRSSYESGLAKYWEIEEKIRLMQERISSLQDEFGSNIVIEDDDARTLMASAALKSCQDSLSQLQEKQEQSAKEAAVEQKKIKNARERLKSLTDEFLTGHVNEEMSPAKIQSTYDAAEAKSLEQEEHTGPQDRQDLELLRNKIKEHFSVESNESLTVTELAEKIDELVNKVISLEASISLQTALIQRLRTETGELQAQIQTLEDDKATLISGKKDLSEKLREMEEKLQGVQDLNKSVKDQNNNLQTNFTETHLNLDHLSERLHSVKADEELQTTVQASQGSTVEAESQKQSKGKEGLKRKDILEKMQNTNQDLKGSVERESGFNGQQGGLDLQKAQHVKQEEDVKDKSLKAQEVAASFDAVQEPRHMKPEEEIKDTSKSDKEFKDQESALNPHGLQKPQHVKPDEEVKVSDSSQKEEIPAKTIPPSQPKEEEEGKLNRCDVPETVASSIAEENIKEHNVSTSNMNGTENPNQSHRSDELGTLLEISTDPKMVENLNKDGLPKTVDEQASKNDGEPDWKQMFTNGLENREKTLLKEYTAVLRNYKEVKKKLNETENKHEDKKGGDSLFDVMLQLRELKTVNAKKDEQIRALRQKLNLLQGSIGKNDNSTVVESPVKEKEVVVDLKMLLMENPETTSEIEEKFRMNIDEVLEENLDFWLRFSSNFHEIQKFETEIKDLQCELSKLEEKQKKIEGSSSSKYSLKSDAKPLYKHLREIHTELSVWIEKSMLLKGELKSRFSSLCDIQEEITAALKESAEDDIFKFTSYQAAKFQGEILNMKQENNKVADELQTGLDHVTTLQLEVERSLARLNDEFKLSGSKHQQNIQLQHSDSRSRVPLRSFIFGNKPKKQKHSIFSCVHPVLQRKYQGLKAATNL